MTADGVDITNNQSRGPKTKAQREQAAKMRKLGACPACKRSKQKCEPSHHRPAPMSTSSSQNPSSASSPWQSSGSASASTSPGSRASISPHTSFGQSFSPASQTPMAAANLPCSFAFPADMANEFVPGDWQFTSDQLLAANSNVPGLDPWDLLDFDAAAALDEDFFSSAPASADNVFSHVQDRPNMQPRGFEGGAWYNDFVLSSYFNDGDADASLSSAPASVGEPSAQTRASVSPSQSEQSGSPHVSGQLEGDRGLSPWSSSGEAGGSSGSPELDRFRDRNANTSELVLDGPMWSEVQSDSSSPTHDPRTAAPTQQRQSSDDIVDIPSDRISWPEPQNTMPRRQSRVTSERIPSSTSSADDPISRAAPYTTDLRVADESGWHRSRAMARTSLLAQAALVDRFDRLEYQKVLRDSRRESSMSSYRPPSESALSPQSERDTLDTFSLTSGSATWGSRRRRVFVASAKETEAVTSSSMEKRLSSGKKNEKKPGIATARSLVSSAFSSPPPAPLQPDTQLQAAVARYVVSSALSPSSSRSAASGEDGLTQRRDRYKPIAKPPTPCACITPTAVPAKAQCACTTPPTILTTVATPSRHSTGLLGGMVDGIRKRVLSFFRGGDGGVEGLLRGMGRLKVE